MKYLKLFESFNNIDTIVNLTNKLREYNIPIDYWGTENAKTIEHLWDELKGGECSIKEENGYLVRSIEFVGIIITYIDGEGKKYLLKEDRQEFKDGRIRKRKMQSSVSEKMKFGEDPIESAIRGIEEELNIKISKNQLKKFKDLAYDSGSQSYPGLKTRYKGHQFTCILNDEQFDKNGYMEVQKDKSTFFKWQEEK